MEEVRLDDDTLPLILLGSFGLLLLSASVIFFFFRYQQKMRIQSEMLLLAELEFKQRLLQANIRSQEEERVRISRELHDNIGSSLSTLRLLAKQLEKKEPDSEEAQALSHSYGEIMNGVIDEIRDLSHSLAPPGLAIWGLQEAIVQLCEKVNATEALRVTVTGSNKHVAQMPFEQALALYRVVQELLTNTLKHASAKEAEIHMGGNETELQLHYKDDGTGADITATLNTGIGMQNMKSRVHMTGGSYSIDTAPGKGFRAVFYIPIIPTEYAQPG